MDQIPALRIVNPLGARALPWIFVASLMLVAVRALAGTVSLAWNPVTSPSLVRYFVYYGPASGYYFWRIDVGSTITYTVSELVEGGTYLFAVAAYDASGAMSALSNDVSATVYSKPDANFSASTTSGTAPLAMNFTSTSTGPISTFAWSFGDGTTSSDENPTHVYSAVGVYTVSLTVTGPGGQDTLTLSNYIAISAAPVGPVTPEHPRIGIPRTPDLRTRTPQF